MNIRSATPADASALARIQVDSYRNTYTDFLPASFLDHFSYEEQTQDWRDLLTKPGAQLLLVAETAEGRLIGYALGHPGTTVTLGYDSELVALHVRLEYQRQGVGRALFAALAERLWQLGCASLTLTMLLGNPASAFYEKLGGLNLGERMEVIDPDTQLPATIYGWPTIEKLCVPENIDDWFTRVRAILETAYTAAPDHEPWLQSGQSGPYDRWEALRKPTANCLNRDGTFLDIGCANGYLMECCVRWAAERGVHIEPYGLDYSDKLVALAQRRLPHWSDRFFIGNALTWQPPMRFDFVRTELVYVPAHLERKYIDILRTTYLNPEGKLLIAQYGEGKDNPQAGLLPGSHPTRFILDRLTDLGIPVIGYKDGVDAVKGRRTRIAIVAAGESNPPNTPTPASRSAQSPD